MSHTPSQTLVLAPNNMEKTHGFKLFSWSENHAT